MLDLPPALDLAKPALIRPAEHSLLRPGAFRPCDRAQRLAIVADLVRTRRLTPAEAQQAMFFVPVVGWGQSIAPFTLTFMGYHTDGLTAALHTFSGVSLGDDVGADNVRYTVVAVSGRDFFSNGSVAGRALSLVSNGSTDASSADSLSHSFIVMANTTGQGGSGTITIAQVSSAGVGGFGIAVYRLINPSGAEAHDVAVDNAHTSGVITVSLDIPTGGAAVGVTMGTDRGTDTWDGLTEDYDDQLGDASRRGSAASGGSEGSPHPIVATNSDTTPQRMTGCSASWGP